MSDPDPAAAALDAAAEEAGVSREALLRRAIVSIAESEGVDVPDAGEVAAIEARLDDLDAELDEKVGDLRERFVELYREVEAAGGDDPDATDGEYPDAARVDALADDLETVTSEVDALAARLDAVEAAADGDRIDGLRDRVAGIEERLDAVDDAVDAVGGDDADRLDEFDDKLSRLASAVVRVRRRLDAAERDRDDRDRVAELMRTANRGGVRTADCDNCGGAVRLGLLSAPECPHCGRRFSELEPNTGFLGTSRLLVADPPAIDGDVDDDGATSPAASDGGSDGVRR